MHRDDVKDDQEGDKQTENCEETEDDNKNAAFAAVEESWMIERHEGHEDEREKNSADETKDVSVVVHPRKEPEEKQNEEDAHQFSDCEPRAEKRFWWKFELSKRIVTGHVFTTKNKCIITNINKNY